MNSSVDRSASQQQLSPTPWIRRVYARVVFWPTWGWNLLLGRVLGTRHWWDSVQPYLWLGARPLRGDVFRLKELGVRAIVNTCAEFPGHLELYRQLGIEQLWLPVVDFTHPSLEQVRAGVAFIESQISAGRGVYIHCKAGRGRSATVAACWLMHSERISARAAQHRLTACRPHVNRHLAERPVVQEFARVNESLDGPSPCESASRRRN